jgi:hypothetical protein
MDDVADALRTGEPLPLLGFVSSLLTALHPRLRPPLLDPTDLQPPPFDEVVQSFFDAPMPETSAVLAAVAVLLGDDLLRRRVQREVADRGHVLPRWLAELDRARPAGRVVQMGHVLGDGDNVLVGVELSDGHQATAVVYIDHNMGSLVKDAFVVPEPVDEVVGMFRATTDDPDVSFSDLDPAEARSRVTAAIELWEMSLTPLESETWPACRPFVEWVVGMLPPGAALALPEWPDDALQALADRVVASPFGQGLDDADSRDLLTVILGVTAEHSPGDPLRWSPVAVEVLLDRLPRHVLAEPAVLAQAPRVLRALVRFSHAERGIRGELTGETLAAVDAFEPRYQAAIRSNPQTLAEQLGQDALDAALGSLIEHQLDRLHRAVGGAQALADLDAEPLPDEAFDWASVPADVHEHVAAVLTVVDRCCAELFDVELRTAARRLLARAAAGRPELFRGRTRPETSAAAVCWIVAKANDVFEQGPVTVQDLMRTCGAGKGTPSQRGKALLAAVGVDATDYAYDPCLGSPDYLTAATRTDIVAARDRLNR